MTFAENSNEMPHDDEMEGLKTKLLATDTKLQITATELKATQVELEVTKQELETAKKHHSELDASLVASVTSFARPTSPDGWLLCDGQEVSRSVYARLFEAIGTIYGDGDGETTFNLPDMRGLFIRGHDPIGKNDSKREFASYQDDQIQSHSHTDSGHNHQGSTSSNGSHSHRGSVSTEGEHKHNGKTGTGGSHVHDFTHDDFNFVVRKNNNNGTTYASGGLRAGTTAELPGFTTDGRGNHIHDLYLDSAGSHAHYLTISIEDSHLHQVTTDTQYSLFGNPTNSGSGEPRHGEETRVKNIALIYCIKY